jgi:hypothetical protein
VCSTQSFAYRSPAVTRPCSAGPPRARAPCPGASATESPQRGRAILNLLRRNVPYGSNCQRQGLLRCGPQAFLRSPWPSRASLLQPCNPRRPCAGHSVRHRAACSGIALRRGSAPPCFGAGVRHSPTACWLWPRGVFRSAQRGSETTQAAATSAWPRNGARRTPENRRKEKRRVANSGAIQRGSGVRVCALKDNYVAPAH